MQHDHPAEPLGLIARLRSEAYRIAEYGLQRDHSMAADELERLLHKCRDAAALADVRLSEENDDLIEQNKVLLAALEEIDWLVEGEVDINGNGGPNTAMKVRTVARAGLYANADSRREQ